MIQRSLAHTIRSIGWIERIGHRRAPSLEDPAQPVRL
jgi:hypothetical protein